MTVLVFSFILLLIILYIQINSVNKFPIDKILHANVKLRIAWIYTEKLSLTFLSSLSLLNLTRFRFNIYTSDPNFKHKSTNACHTV